jgi:regulator of sirC expression with transglutaminase-like and TPR domain
MEINPEELRALIFLLEDPDPEVQEVVRQKITDFGPEVIPFLEEAFLKEPTTENQIHINEMIEDIQFSILKSAILNWESSGAKDLFDGVYLSCLFKYPQLNKQDLNNRIDKIKLDCWLELSFQKTPIDKVRALNYILYNRIGLKGNTDNYHIPDNCYINRVLELKKGNPVSMAIIYSLVAQRLNIPIFGVNLPQHFILAYKDDLDIQNYDFNSPEFLEYNRVGEVLFYINPFNNGSVFSKNNLDQFLDQLKIQHNEYYYNPCSNIDIIIRVFRNLSFAYEKAGDEVKSAKIQELVDLLFRFGTPVA